MDNSDLRRVTRAQLTWLGVQRNKPWLFAGTFFVLLGLAWTAMPFGMYHRDAGIVESGARAEAIVGDLNWQGDGDGGYEGDVEYTFSTASGEAVTGREHDISRETFDRLSSGDVVIVAYGPEKPSDNFPLDPDKGVIGGFWKLGTAALFSAFGLIPVIFGGLILWGLFLRLPGQWAELLVHGQTTDGVIVHHRQHDDSGLGDRVMLGYSFAGRFGAQRIDETQYVSAALAAEWPVGASGQVRFDPRSNESLWLGRGDLTFLC